jgi:predicted MFS family arabinose efflux permease
MAGDRLWTVPFVALTLADLAYFTAIGMAVYALPLFVTGPLGSDEAAAGLTFGVFALTALLLRPLAGRLTDACGRRPLLVAGAVLCAAGMALLPLAGSVPAAVAIRMLQGVGEAAFFVASFAALADLAPAHRLGEALSYSSLGLYLGLALGPPLAETLLGRGGFDLTWGAAAALGGVAAVLAVVVGETRRPVAGASAGGGHGRLLYAPAVPVSVGFLTSLLAVGGFLTFASLHAGAVGLEDTSRGLLVYGLTVVVCRIAFARVPDRLPALPLAAVSLLVTALGLLVVAAWATPTGFLVGIVVLAVGVAFSTPAFFTAVFQTAGPEGRGAASGTASAFLDLGLGAGPILLGLIAAQVGVRGAFVAGALVAGLGCLWVLSLHRRGSGAPPPYARRS